MAATGKLMRAGGFRRLAMAVLLAVLSCGAGQTVHAQSGGERDAVLAANSEFYRAFRDGDLDGMDQVWATRGDISVQHPSGWRLEGRAAVMQSWASLLRAPPQITCIVQGVSFAAGRATVYCNEQLNPGSVRMKNIFHREGGTWKMIYHGPVPKDEVVS
jgi:hypothetical protein